jgi:tol-pal system protein YbgF
MTDRRARRPGRRAALLLLVGLSAAASGCATKKDLKQLRDEVLTLQARQDSLFRVQERNYRQLLDTMRASFNMQLDAQGQTSHRFLQLEQQLGRAEAMLNELQQLLAQTTQRLEQQQSVAAQNAAARQGGAGVTEQDSGDAAMMYRTGVAKLAEGAYATARVAFEEVVNLYADRPVAADAQFYIGETYAKEGEPDRAIAEYAKVAERWRDSPRAPEALLQAGIVAEEMKNNKALARTYYDQVFRMYPNSDAFKEAQRRLRG